MENASDSVWATSVQHLLELLRQALTALVPVAERARMPWRDGEAYDDWDAIAACLYDNIVTRTISYSRELIHELKMPNYDMVYPSYRGMDFILVEGQGIPTGLLAVFVGFAGIAPDFPAVGWLEINSLGDVLSEEVRLAPYDRCSFSLVQGGDLENRVTALTIDL